MKSSSWSVAAAALLFGLGSAGAAADQGELTVPVQGQANQLEIGAENARTQGEVLQDKATSSRATCLSHCDAAEGRCGSEVRRARSECSRRAAMSGREPFARDNDYSYFCSYFRSSGRHCGADRYSAGCRERLAQRYGTCVEAMYDNIASMRFDCFRNERDAQNLCREELRDCRAACQ
jgi:hypothetical protein